LKSPLIGSDGCPFCDPPDLNYIFFQIVLAQNNLRESICYLVFEGFQPLLESLEPLHCALVLGVENVVSQLLHEFLLHLQNFVANLLHLALDLELHLVLDLVRHPRLHVHVELLFLVVLLVDVELLLGSLILLEFNLWSHSLRSRGRGLVKADRFHLIYDWVARLLRDPLSGAMVDFSWSSRTREISLSPPRQLFNVSCPSVEVQLALLELGTVAPRGPLLKTLRFGRMSVVGRGSLVSKQRPVRREHLKFNFKIVLAQ